MNEIITSAAGLDALPERTLAENAHTLIRKTPEGWQTLGGSSGSFWWDSAAAAEQGPWTVLHRPGADPACTDTTEEQVVSAINSRLPILIPDGFLLEAARAVLALLPSRRCAPSEEEIAAAVRIECDGTHFEKDCPRLQAVRALLSSQPSVEEAKAQGVRDFAAHLRTQGFRSVVAEEADEFASRSGAHHG